MSLVELDRYTDPVSAQVVRSRLEAAGILAFCFDEHLNAVYSQPLLFPVRVLILDEQIEEAREILGERIPLTEAERAAEGYHTSRRGRRLALVLIVGFLLFQVGGVLVMSLVERAEREPMPVDLPRDMRL